MRIVTPATAWAMIATIDEADLVAAGDFLVTANPFQRTRALARLDDLREAANARRGCIGHQVRARALEQIAVGAVSRTESLMRVACARVGLPTPQLNFHVGTAFLDLAWPQFHVGAEYEGDHHRERKQFRDDMVRIEKVLDREWLVTKASADDLFDRLPELVGRIDRRLRSRGWDGVVDLRKVGHFRR